MGNATSDKQKKNDSASGEEFSSTDDELEDRHPPPVGDDPESDAPDIEAEVDEPDDNVPSEEAEEDDDEEEDHFGDDGRPILDPRQARKSMRMLYSLGPEEPAEGENFPPPGAPVFEKETAADLKEKKKNWRKSMGKVFKRTGFHKAMIKSKTLKRMRTSVRAALDIKKKADRRLGTFELTLNSELHAIKNLSHFPTKHLYSQYLLQTLQAGVLVRCTLDYPYGLRKDTCGRYEQPWPAGPSTHGLFTWKDWEHPISGISTFALAWSLVEIIDPRTADPALLATVATPRVSNENGTNDAALTPIGEGEEDEEKTEATSYPGGGDEADAYSESTTSSSKASSQIPSNGNYNPFDNSAEGGDNPFEESAEDSDNPFEKMDEGGDNPFNKIDEGGDNPFDEAAKGGHKNNPFDKLAEGGDNSVQQKAVDSNYNPFDQVEEEDKSAQVESAEDATQDQVEDKSAEAAHKNEDEWDEDANKSDEESTEMSEGWEKSAEPEDKSDEESSDDGDKNAEAEDNSDKIAEAADKGDEAKQSHTDTAVGNHSGAAPFDSLSATMSTSSVASTSPAEEKSAPTKKMPRITSPLSPLSDFEMDWSDDGELSDDDDEHRRVAQIKEALRPGMRVRTTEKYMANAPQKGCVGTYIHKHATEMDYGMFVWEGFTNAITGSDRCVAPLFAVTLLEQQPSTADREAWIQALKEKEKRSNAEARDKVSPKKDAKDPSPVPATSVAREEPKATRTDEIDVEDTVDRDNSDSGDEVPKKEERESKPEQSKTPPVRRELFRSPSSRAPETPPPPSPVKPIADTKEQVEIKKAIKALSTAQEARAELRGTKNKNKVKYRRLIKVEEEAIARLTTAIEAAKKDSQDTGEAEKILSKGHTALLTINDLNDARRMLKAAILVADEARCAFVVSALLEEAASHGMEATDPLIEQTFAVVQAIVEEESDFEEVLTETLADMKLSLSGDTSNLNEAQLTDLLETNGVAVDVYKELASRLEDADRVFQQFATHASEELVKLAKEKRRHHERIRRKLRALKQYSDKAEALTGKHNLTAREREISEDDSDDSWDEKKKKRRKKGRGEDTKKKKKKKKSDDSDGDDKRKKKRKKDRKKKKDADTKRKKKRKKKQKKKVNDLFLGTEVMVHSSTGNDLEGTVRFYGATDFHPGTWVGVELNEPMGKNDGSVAGVSYFTCKDKFGLFTQPASCRAKHGTMPERLATYYETHAPDKVHLAADIIASFAGNEATLFGKLEQKYGEPVR